MRKHVCLVCVLLFTVLSPTAFADTAAIQSNALPQEAAVLAALVDATQLEPYTHAWTPTWNYPIAKKDAAKRLQNDLKALEGAVKAHPENVELQLLTALVARYAYNVDVKDSDAETMAALTAAASLAPADVRATWFHAAFYCATTKAHDGAEEMLAIESSHKRDELPAGFWDDYIDCASVTDMPEHVLRAADYLDKLHSPVSQRRSALVDIAQKRFNRFEPTKDYESKDVWMEGAAGTDPTFTSTACGLRLQVRQDWRIERLAVTQGSCVAIFATGPYLGSASSLAPNLMVMVQRPENGETLEAYSKRFLTKGTFTAFTPVRCPADQCIAMKGVQAGMYQKDGDGHPLTLFFARDEPAYPELIFESPILPPSAGPKQGAAVLPAEPDDLSDPGQAVLHCPGGYGSFDRGSGGEGL